MSRIFFQADLEGVAIYWRIERRDGVTLGFVSHDRDLEFAGVRYRAAPGMLPSAIRRNASLELDDAEVQGVLSHDSIREDELSLGRFDNARIEIGLVDWESLERSSIYNGQMGAISFEAGSFEAELRSAKAQLERDTLPRTAPTCRAPFCGPGCGLSASRFTHAARVERVDSDTGKVAFAGGPPPASMVDGTVRWIDGALIGAMVAVIQSAPDGLVLDMDPSVRPQPGQQALLREGCDHTLQTCQARFSNSVNFRGEPFLPGNDALVRYPTSSS